MSSHNPNLDQPAEPTDSTEARMRQALGLGSRPAATGHGGSPTSSNTTSHDPARQRRRFAQDGEVPVVILHRGRDGDAAGENKLAALTADLREERAARLKSERALEEANALIQSLRTKLKHTEMTWDEKLRDEREARAQVDALLLAERAGREQAEVRAAEAALALSLLERAAPAIAEPVAPPPSPQAEAPLLRDLFEDARAPDAAVSAAKGRAVKKTKATPEPSLPLNGEDGRGTADRMVAAEFSRRARDSGAEEAHHELSRRGRTGLRDERFLKKARHESD